MQTQGRKDQLWTFRAAETVDHVAAAGGPGWSLIATGGRTVHILDGTGKLRGRFKAGQPIRQLCASREASVLTALAGEAVVYAFNVRGELDWRVELGGAVAAFAMDARGEHFAAVSAAGWLFTYSPATRERGVAPVGWPMASVAVSDGDNLRIVVAGEDGRIALLNREGKAQWQKSLECRIGPVSGGGAGGPIFVPAHGRGLLVFGPDGREAGKLQLGADVVRAQAGPSGFPVMAELGDGRLVLVEKDSSVKWEGAVEASGRPWAFGAAGTRLILAEGGRSVAAYEVAPAAAAPAVEAPAGAPPAVRARPPEHVEPVEVEVPEYLEIEEAMAGRTPTAVAPQKPRQRLAWKKKLPPEALPVRQGLLRLSVDGGFAVAVLADGTVVGLDWQGRPAIKASVDGPADLAPGWFTGTVGVRAGGRLLVLDLASGSTREVALAEKPVAAFGCSEDLRALYVLDAEGTLHALGGDGVPLWRKALGAEARSLLVSATGETVLVSDSDGRFRYYGSDAALRRKFRFGDAGSHEAAALADDFSAFVAADGRLTVVDAEGRQAWSRRLFDRLTGVERLDGALAVYGENGACAAVEPLADRVWEFSPPPGRALLRKAGAADPVVVHAAGPAITVFAGYRRKLDALWRHQCSGDVEAFDADRAARSIVALADGKIHRLEDGRS